MAKFCRELRKAVREHYKWHLDKKAEPIKWVSNRDGYQMLLVRVVDRHGDKWSLLMHCQDWKDGHWDVWEALYCEPDEEENMIHDFEQSGITPIVKDGEQNDTQS